MVLQMQFFFFLKIAFPAPSFCSVCVPVKGNLHYTSSVLVAFCQEQLQTSAGKNKQK